MSSTTFVDTVPGPAGSGGTPGTKIVASWLNDVNITVYTALGTGGVAPTTAADVISNLNLPTLGAATNTFTGNATFGGTLGVTGAVTLSSTLGVTGTVTLSGALVVAGAVTMSGAINEARTTVASAATPDIWTATGNIVDYTGTTTATGFAAAPQAGARRVLDCAAAATFTAGANMLIDGVPSGSTLTVVAGDRVEVMARSTTQFVLRWVRSDGNAPSPSSLVGGARNAMMTVATASASGTFTADEVVVKSALSGAASVLGSYSQAINLATTGAGGMDTGTAPVSGFVALYAISAEGGYSPSILACNVTTSSGSVYSGANMPTGYTQSALIGIWPTNASSQFVAGYISGRDFYPDAFTAALTGSSDIATLTSQSLSTAGVPAAAKRVSLLGGNNTASTAGDFFASGTSAGGGAMGVKNYAASGTQDTIGGFAFYQGFFVKDLPMPTSQTVYVVLRSATATNYLYVTGYSW